jgi:hypothetical protein
VSASSATTPVEVEAYMTPCTTIGVCCAPTPSNVHALVRRDTFVVSICFSLEYFVPAKSPANLGQSASVNGVTPTD